MARFVNTCLECFKPMAAYAWDHLDCTDCPNCGHHRHGARQQQLAAPCTKER